MQIVRYPDWPRNREWPLLSQWKKDSQPTKVEMGKGFLASDIGFPKETGFEGPHPEFVKEWRAENNATVSRTAEYFGLTDVQVLQACR